MAIGVGGVLPEADGWVVASDGGAELGEPGNAVGLDDDHKLWLVLG